MLQHILISAAGMRERKFVWALILAALSLISAPASSQEVAGTIESISGPVNVIHGGQLRSAQVGMELLAGARITTGPGGYAEVRLRDETQLAIGPDCRIRISRFQFDPKTNVGNMLVTVVKGALRVTTGLIGRRDPKAVQFRTIVGTVGIRGTQFIVESGEY